MRQSSTTPNEAVHKSTSGYAGMPWGEAERNLGSFASEVMPRFQVRAISGNVAWGA